MKSKWDDKIAQEYIDKYAENKVSTDLALRVYSAQLIGQETSLVLHGGGNTSVKSSTKDITDKEVKVLHVKGSGWDLATIEPEGHPAVKLEPLLAMRTLDSLSDEDMVNNQRINLLNFSSPNPSVETLLHAFIPCKFIDHTHADAILAIANQPNSTEIIEHIYGDSVGIVPYIMPGFALAKKAAEVYEDNPNVKGLILVNHGIFSFAETAKESYKLMIDLVSQAEAYIEKANRSKATISDINLPSLKLQYAQIAPRLRGALALDAKPTEGYKKRLILEFRTNPQILNFVNKKNLVIISQLGPPTPDHVIRTKRVPLILDNIDDIDKEINKFQRAYEKEFITNCKKSGAQRQQLDSMPRVVLVKGLGLIGIGKDLKAAKIAADIYEHTIDIIENAQMINQYLPLDPLNLFDMEYWSLEQAKLGKSKDSPLTGQIALITGAASGIGQATALEFYNNGAHLVLWDKNLNTLEKFGNSLTDQNRVYFEKVDVTDSSMVEKAIKNAVIRYGGIDIAVSNAGKAWSQEMANVDIELLNDSMALNLNAHQSISAEMIKVLKQQNSFGCLLYNASKSTFNPGPNFGPYTIPKAALIALMKQYALEYGEFGVRCNAVNADRVNTDLFGDGMLETRAKARDLTVSEYLSGNLLKKEVLATDVAKAFLSLALAYKTTGAVLPVDGGNIAASPR